MQQGFKSSQFMRTTCNCRKTGQSAMMAQHGNCSRVFSALPTCQKSPEASSDNRNDIRTSMVF
jgi:hypothetical protein